MSTSIGREHAFEYFSNIDMDSTEEKKIVLAITGKSNPEVNYVKEAV